MSKLNPVSRPRTVQAVAAQRGETVGTSANGNVQFVKGPQQMLYEVVATSMFGKGNMLRSADTLVQMVKTNLQKVVDARQFDFIANLAIHARTELNIRTMPIVLVVEFAHALAVRRQSYEQSIEQLETKLAAARKAKRSTVALVTELTELREERDLWTYDKTRTLVADVIRRADQITDLYAYALTVFGSKNKIPMAVKRGVADAFNKFSEYAFSKYNRDGSVKFRDVLRIVHPQAKNVSQGEIFARIMADNLAVAYTWETELSANGQAAVGERKSKKDLWTELVSSGKVGYMALLRNLRNIHEADLDAAVLKEFVLDVISDPARVAESKQLPYDFMEAYKIVKPINARMATAVSKAIDASVSNIPVMGEKVWLIVDYSGSMGRETDETSAISGGVFLAAALLKANADASNLAVTLFGSSAKTLHGVDTNNSMIALQAELLKHRTGGIAGSTEFGAALREQSKLGFTPDTIIVVTDGEVNRFPYHTVAHLGGRKTIKMTVNMSTAFTTPMSREDGWYALAGWNTSMFKWVPAMREAGDAVSQLSGEYTGPQAPVEKAVVVKKVAVKRRPTAKAR